MVKQDRTITERDGVFAKGLANDATRRPGWPWLAGGALLLLGMLALTVLLVLALRTPQSHAYSAVVEQVSQEEIRAFRDRQAMRQQARLESEQQTKSPSGAESAPVAAPEPEPEPEPEPDTTVDNFTIFVGDSRTAQMAKAVEYDKEAVAFVAEARMGYDWLMQYGIWQAESLIRDGATNIVVNMGVNDTSNVERYVALINQRADDWQLRGCQVFYASVNPVKEAPGIPSNAQIEEFNQVMTEELDESIHWIDSYRYLTEKGFTAADGVHYSEKTYQTLFQYYLEAIAPLD